MIIRRHLDQAKLETQFKLLKKLLLKLRLLHLHPPQVLNQKLMLVRMRVQNYHLHNIHLKQSLLEILQQTDSQLMMLKLELKQLKPNQNMYQPQHSQLQLKTHGQKLVTPKKYTLLKENQPKRVVMLKKKKRNYHLLSILQKL